MSSFTKFLKNMFSPTGKDSSSPETPAPSPIEPAAAEKETAEQPATLGNFKDLLDFRETVQACLVDQMKVYRGGAGYPDLTVWIDDPVVLQMATDPFQEELKKALLHSGCHPRSAKTTLLVKQGVPPAGVPAVTLAKPGKLNSGKVFLTFQNQVTAQKATLAICRGKGSLEVDPFLVDPAEKSRYRIGRGETSNRPDYTFRINDIIIRTDDPDEAVQNLNNHVSSAHADLICREGRFYLQALPSGALSGCNPTRIVRDQTPVNLDQMGIDYPLQDGDLIELGNSVLLEFKFV